MGKVVGKAVGETVGKAVGETVNDAAVVGVSVIATVGWQALTNSVISTREQKVNQNRDCCAKGARNDDG
jgi:hypothetical protein